LALLHFVYATDNNAEINWRQEPYAEGGVWVAHLVDEKTTALVICPSAPLHNPPPVSGNREGAADQAWVRWAGDGTVMFTGSYGYNGWLYQDISKYFASSAPEKFVFTKNSIQNPSLTPVFVDADWVGLTPKETDPPARNLYAGRAFGGPGSMSRCTIARHGGVNPASAPRAVAPGQKMPGAINLGAADGRAQLVPLENLWNFYWHLNWQPPAVRPP
jgi:hypothetical protein